MNDLTVVWIDDQPDSVLELADRLRVANTVVTVMSPMEVGLVESAVSADAIILDLNWDHAETSDSQRVSTSVELLHAVSARKPVPAIIYSSAFFSNHEFARIERKVSPLVRSTRIDKSLLVTEVRQEGAGARGQVNIDQLRNKIESVSGQARRLSRSVGNLALQLEPDGNANSPWNVGVDEYLRMSLDEKFKLTDRAADACEELVDRSFDETSADWLIIGGARPTVVQWGTAEDRPSDARILEIGRAQQRVVYFFSRPMQLD